MNPNEKLVVLLQMESHDTEVALITSRELPGLYVGYKDVERSLIIVEEVVIALLWLNDRKLYEIESFDAELLRHKGTSMMLLRRIKSTKNFSLEPLNAYGIFTTFGHRKCFVSAESFEGRVPVFLPGIQARIADDANRLYGHADWTPDNDNGPAA